MANEVVAVCDSLELESAVRRNEYAECLSLYDGRPVSLETDDYHAEGIYEASLYNLSRSACDAVKADIAGRQKPKPTFVTTGGDWRAKRKAKHLDRFVEGQLSCRQGCYATAWQLMEACFHDSAKLGNGIAKVSADIQSRKVRIERVFPWELHVDAREARYGDPQNLFHTYDLDQDLAIAAFVTMKPGRDPDVEITDDENVSDDDAGFDVPATEEDEKKLQAILTAQERPYAFTSTGMNRVVSTVRVREAWHLPINEEHPGKHVIAVPGCVLFEEDWTAPEFPFVFLSWEKDTVGFWSTGIIAAHKAQHVETNLAARRLQERIAVCSTKRTYVEANSVNGEDMIRGGEGEVVITVKDISRLPVERDVQPASPQEFQWVEMNKSAYYAFSGVSQMSASAQKEPGVDAAVAMQTLNDISTVRFMPKARAYEAAFATLGRLCVRAAAAVAEFTGGYLVKWPGKKFQKELDWNDVSLDEDMYDVRVTETSMYSRDPAAMLQMAQELHQGGLINRETFLEMMQMPDLAEVLNRETAERGFLEELFSRYLDSTDNDELTEAGGYEAPEPFIANKPAAMALVIQTYWESKRDGAPEFCLELLRRWIAQLDKLLAAQSAPPPPQEAPGALPQGTQLPAAA